MVAQMIPERDFRGPGCDDRCEVVRAIVPGRFGRSELMLHHPKPHEEYGRVTAGPFPSGSGTIVWTGSLVIDRWARTVTSYGRRVDVTLREWQMLDYLASVPGRLCSALEITRAAWGSDEFAQNAPRVTLARLRSRLGANGRLIETQHTRGYRLVLEPPIEPTPADEPKEARPWARAHPRCVCCGRTDSPHHCHGRCQGCQGGLGRFHYGPCRMPPAGSDGAT